MHQVGVVLCPNDESLVIFTVFVLQRFAGTISNSVMSWTTFHCQASLVNAALEELRTMIKCEMVSAQFIFN